MSSTKYTILVISISLFVLLSGFGVVTWYGHNHKLPPEVQINAIIISMDYIPGGFTVGLPSPDSGGIYIPKLGSSENPDQYIVHCAYTLNGSDGTKVFHTTKDKYSQYRVGQLIPIEIP